MPNSLGHYGIQGLASHALFGRVDPRWVMTGCIVPDVPWIAQRIAGAAAPGIDPYAMRLYFVAQASLPVTLTLCGAVAAFAPKPRRIFLLLAFNSLLHLLLDACQTKWGNGVHLFAPLSWDTLNLGLFWPEQWPSHLLTAFGVGYVAWAGRHGLWSHFAWTARRWWIVALLLACYVALPALLERSAYDANVHDARVLREARVGESVAFDREEVVLDTAGPRLRGWNDRLYDCGDALPARASNVSLQGTLTAPERIRVSDLHDHAGAGRDLASAAGLAVLALALGVGLVRRRTPGPESSSKQP